MCLGQAWVLQVSGAVSLKSLVALCDLGEIAEGNSQADRVFQFHRQVLRLSGICRHLSGPNLA